MSDSRPLLTAIIVDDEERARNVLKMTLEEYCPEISIVELCADVPKAVNAINKLKPDIVFLDIEMPGYTGFQLFDFFENPQFSVIFTTAYSEYAIQAIKASAIDYLLKPIQAEELKTAVAKAMDKKQIDKQEDRIVHFLENVQNEHGLQKIALPTSYGYVFVHINDLVYLAADGSYTNIYLADGQKILVSRKLKEFEYLEQHPFFFKSHRSFIVNLNCVKQYHRNDGGMIMMNEGSKIALSRDKKEEFLLALKNIGVL
jgi:two-component system, LytTR family, response regulator